MTRKIGVFGGTFNPIHYGHINSIQTILEKLDLDKVYVIPTYQNPLRQKIEGPNAMERFEMVKLGVETISDDRVEVLDIEIGRGGESYTVDTLDALGLNADDVYLILGGDNLVDFDRWKSYRKILAQTNLVFTSRPGSTLPKSKESMPQWLRENLDDFDGQTGILTSGKGLIFLQLEDVDFSSTDVRRLARRGLDVRKYTPGSVATFIEDHCLYDRVGQKIDNFELFTKHCYKILQDKGGIGLQAYDVSLLEQPTDYTIVCSGTSSRHVLALVDYVSQSVKDEFGVYPQGLEGVPEGRWVVIDYGGLMIHIFYDYVRNEYRIEELWRSGKRLEY